MTRYEPISSKRKKPLDLKGISLFVLLSFSLAWLAVLPLWFSDKGLRLPLATLWIILMMQTPAISALIVVFLLKTEPGKKALFGFGLGPKGWWKFWLFTWTVIPFLVLAAPFISAVLGFYTLDLTGFSGFQELIRNLAGEDALSDIPVPISILVVISVLQGFILAPLLNGIVVFGEELGWRGYLLPKLLPLGQWPALVISGAIWGLWHTPVILLGHNYPDHPRMGIFMMTVFCVIFGIILGWTRIATGSIWPAVIGHGAINGMGGVISLFHKAGTEFDTIHAGITGWTGWILPVILILTLYMMKRLPVIDPSPDEESPMNVLEK